MGDEIHRRIPYKAANSAKQMRSESRWRRRTAKAAVTRPTAAKAAPKNRYGASRRNAVKTSSALISDAPPHGQIPSEYSLSYPGLISDFQPASQKHSSSPHRPACVASPGFGASGGLIRPFPFCKPVSGASPFTLEFRHSSTALRADQVNDRRDDARVRFPR